MAKIGRNEPCPCGTGKKYKHCCAGKVFAWDKESEGSFAQEFPVEGDLKDLIEEQRTTFFRHFEREPGAGDPMLLGKYLLSSDDIKRKTVEAMEKAGIDLDKIYAYRKTGYLITESSLDRATGAAIREWDDAIEEFHKMGGDTSDTPEGKRFDSLLSNLTEELESLIYLFGVATDQFFNTDSIPEPANPSSMMSPSQYQALCMVRTHRTLRSIRVLLSERMSDDVLKLARAMYENYLHVVYVGRHPNKVADLVDANLGLRAGSHAYKSKKDGSENRRIIVDKRSGREHDAHISAYEMAEASPFVEDIQFFDFFYRHTSEFLHPSIFTLDAYLSEHGLDAVKPHMYEESVIFSACISAMVADRIPSMEGCPGQIARDCVTIVTRVKSILLEMLEILSVWQKNIDMEREDIYLLQKRCHRLSNG